MNWRKWKRSMLVAALSAAVLAIGFGIAYLGTTTRRACRALQPVDESVPRENFLVTYAGARDLFLRSAAEAGGRIESVEKPMSGTNGESLFTDFALFGSPQATATLVIGSGTHGVEGFTGSGIQSRLLQSGFVSDLPTGVNVLMVHAINPYGMAHLRRVNEDNVDLNRNFRDHSEKPAPNPGYEALADVINPSSVSFWSEVRSWSRVARYRIGHGTVGTHEAIGGAQYSHPEGLFYGGVSESWSNRTLRSVVGRYLSGTTRVVFVDFHTGLGEYGSAEVILNVPENSEEFGRARQIWGPENTRSTVAGTSVSIALDASLKLALHQIAPPEAEVTAVSLEFGTLPLPKVFAALRAENWLHHRGGPDHARAQEIKTCLLRAFHPASPVWEANALALGERAVVRGLEYLVADGNPARSARCSSAKARSWSPVDRRREA